jgi:plasmid stabilization system protein ParE
MLVRWTDPAARDLTHICDSLANPAQTLQTAV